ncbi:MAG: hypothetical protein ACRD9R_04495 [Pyrinomonadaceae bacterium]
MKPLSTEIQSTDALLELGRASVQVVHDLKNQINGLKLYATFLRKRFEAQERPADEREIIAKLIAGLERAAADMNALVRFGRPLELRRQRSVDVARLLAAASVEGQTLVVRPEDDHLAGELAPNALAEAFKLICEAARARATDKGAPQEIRLRREKGSGSTTAEAATIEWGGVGGAGTQDLFNSFAGSEALRLALAAKIIRAHGGTVAHEADTLHARIPL